MKKIDRYGGAPVTVDYRSPNKILLFYNLEKIKSLFLLPETHIQSHKQY